LSCSGEPCGVRVNPAVDAAAVQVIPALEAALSGSTVRLSGVQRGLARGEGAIGDGDDGIRKVGLND
jgi:hypothetical protein